jgi:hypothetical protein
MWLITMLVFIAGSAAADISKNTFRDPKSGFSISKPSSWEFVNNAKTFGVQLKNDRFASNANDLIVTFRKAMGPRFSGVSPVVGVSILSDVKPSANLVRWLDDELKRQSDQDKFFVPGGTAFASDFDNAKGARASYISSTVINGVDVRVYHVLYLVASGKKVFLINMNCSEEIEYDFVGAFADIAGSVHVRE